MHSFMGKVAILKFQSQSHLRLPSTLALIFISNKTAAANAKWYIGI